MKAFTRRPWWQTWGGLLLVSPWLVPWLVVLGPVICWDYCRRPR